MSKFFVDCCCWGEDERRVAMDRAAGPLPRIRMSHWSLFVGGVDCDKSAVVVVVACRVDCVLMRLVLTA